MPALVFGAVNKMALGEQEVTSENTVVVPIEISNEANLTAADIPLKFSDGVTLKEVSFEGTRVDYFDFKVANINNEDHTVVIGLISQLSYTPKPYLDEGEGVVANLIFEVTDPGLTELSLETVTMDEPRHELNFYYHVEDESGRPLNVRREAPEFSTVTMSLSGAENLPTEYALDQNYPNPFNPNTQIGLSLPSTGHVTLEVFNVLGQKVNTLLDREMAAGSHVVEWNGTSESGESVSSGVYFYRLTTDNRDFIETKKMMLLK
jgi:methionine-rich copper-binding protein CopC